MAIDKTVETNILRYHFVEKWGPHTIAKQLGVHHYTVSRVIRQAGCPAPVKVSKPSIIDPYKKYIHELLERHPRLTAQRIYQMLTERGYSGGPSHLRHYIAQVRPKRNAEAFLKLKVIPGEQAQVDWGHFGHITIGKARRPLMAFVMVLSYSRQLFVKFYLNHRMGNFLRGHRAAFNTFGGVPRVILYDNLKSAVLERYGDAIRFHPTILDLAAHYHFEPKPVAVARGNEKGRVERSIRYIRDNFFSARSYSDVNDLNKQAQTWCQETANRRKCPGSDLTIEQAYEQERGLLLALPDTPFQDEDVETVKASKSPYVRFDLNEYSIPHMHVRKALIVRADGHKVRVFDGTVQIARHQRSYDKGATIEDPEHIATLRKAKRHARTHSKQFQLVQAVPTIETLLVKAGQRGYNLGRLVQQLIALLEQYGRAELSEAVGEALQHDSIHPNSLQQILQRRKDQCGKLPTPPLKLQHAQAQNIAIQPPTLEAYASLTDRDEQRPRLEARTGEQYDEL